MFRPEPAKSLPEIPTSFSNDFLLPRSSAIYYDQDIIVVQFRGSPGGKAMFEIDDLMDDPLPMMELPPEQNRDISGVYRGMYKIKPGDKCEEEPIVFYLEGKDGDDT